MILRSAVPHIPTAFEQLVKLLDRRIIARAVAAHDGDRGVGDGANAWTCERHLKTMLFAQVAGLTSLRGIVEGMAPHRRRFYHLNRRQTVPQHPVGRQPRTTRGGIPRYRAGADPAGRRHAAAAERSAGPAARCDADPAQGPHFGWAEANARTRGLKLHLLHDPRQGRPVWFDVTSAKNR
ncbi:MAG: DUF4372 domain-containing protein [Burkholderiales bacterium]